MTTPAPEDAPLVLARRVLSDHLRSLPDSAFDSVWKQKAEEDKENAGGPGPAPNGCPSIHIDRSCCGPVVFVPEERRYYAFLRGATVTPTATGKERPGKEAHWFVMIQRASSQKRRATIKYLGNTRNHADVYLYYVLSWYKQAHLLYQDMPFEPAP